MLQPKDTSSLNGYKNKTHIYAVYKRPTSDLGHIQTESEGMEKDIPCKWKSKESWSSNTHIRQNRLENKEYYKRQEGHYIMIKGSNQEEDVTIINIYAPNIGAPQYKRQLLTSIKEEIDSNTIIVGDFNTSLTPTDRSSRQKINKETQTLNGTINQIDLIDIYRTFYQKRQNIFSSQLHMEHSPG